MYDGWGKCTVISIFLTEKGREHNGGKYCLDGKGWKQLIQEYKYDITTFFTWRNGMGRTTDYFSAVELQAHLISPLHDFTVVTIVSNHHVKAWITT